MGLHNSSVLVLYNCFLLEDSPNSCKSAVCLSLCLSVCLSVYSCSFAEVIQKLVCENRTFIWCCRIVVGYYIFPLVYSQAVCLSVGLSVCLSFHSCSFAEVVQKLVCENRTFIWCCRIVVGYYTFPLVYSPTVCLSVCLSICLSTLILLQRLFRNLFMKTELLYGAVGSSGVLYLPIGIQFSCLPVCLFVCLFAEAISRF